MTPRLRVLTLAAVAIVISAPHAASEDYFAGKTVAIICGFPPGGGVDALAGLFDWDQAAFIGCFHPLFEEAAGCRCQRPWAAGSLLPEAVRAHARRLRRGEP